MKQFRKKLKNFCIALLLVLVGMGLGFLVLEFGLRIALFGSLQWQQSGYLPFIRVPHPEFGWVPEPNQVAAEDAIEYQHLVSTNDKGLRDESHAYEKEADVYRIVVLGDSYMEAIHVPDGRGFPDVLERLLESRNVEVINLGVGGFSTTAAWLYLQQEGMKYKPDLVLLAFFAENDLHGNSAELSRIFWHEDNIRYYGQPYASWDSEIEAVRIVPPDYDRSYARYQAERAAYSPALYQLDALQKSLASRLFQKMRCQLLTRVSTPGYDANIHLGCYVEDFSQVDVATDITPEQYQQLWDETWQVTRNLIGAINRLCTENNARFAFFNCPARIQFETEYLDAAQKMVPALPLNVDLPENRLAAFATEDDIPFLNLLPAFRQAHVDGEDVNYNHDSHWNETGHRLAAVAVTAWLDEKGLLPPKP